MAIKTEKNAASGSMVIDENRGRDDLRQNPKKRGTSKDVVASLDKRVAGVETSMAELKNQVEGLEGLGPDFESMREYFRVAFNTFSGDLKHEIHDLRDSFMGEIAKIREEFGEEVSTLHQTIEDLKLGRLMISCGRWNNTWKVSTWILRRYGGDVSMEISSELKEGLVQAKRSKGKPRDRKVNHEKGGGDKNAQPKVDHARKPPTRKDRSVKTNYKSGGCFICDGPHRARDCLKKTSLNGMSTHEDEDTSNGESMGSMRILNAIKAKTEVPKVIGKGLQYVEATINSVKVHALVDSGATHNFVAVDEAERLGINATKGSGTIKAVNSPAKPIHEVAKDARAKIGEWEGTIDLSVVLMDDFKVVLGLEFLDKVRAFPMPFANSLCILDGGKTCMVSMERDAKSGSKTLSAMQFKKGFNKSEHCYLAVTRLETDEGLSKVEVPKVIKRVLDEFKDVMPKELPKKLPPKREVDHTIELESGSKPPGKAPYQMPPPELEELRKQLKELIDAGYIRPSKAPYDLFDQLGNARYFTKLDLRSGYYQVRIAEGDEAKMTYVTRYGSYEFLVMPFGLTNAPVTFCTLMNKLFHLFLDKFVVVYLDDIVVYSHTLEEHVDEVEFLGHKIKDGGLMMDDAKIKAIQEWEPPTKVTELRSFLGLVNYYRRFIMGYSAIASPLTNLLKKNQAWIWNEECQAAFESLKKVVIKEPVLRLPDVTMPFELHTDALYFSIGGPRMEDDVETFVQTCLICQQDKIEQKRSGGLLEPLPTPKGPWEIVSMGFITCFLKSEGSGSIIVVVDRFSKYGTFIAAPPDVTADDMAKLFFKNVVKYWGVPHMIVSDRDPRFTGRFWTELFKIMGTDLNFSMSFHPQTDGQTERVNALLELYLRHYSPFELVTGRQPLTPNALAASYEGSSLAVYKTMKEWHEQADMAWASLDKATKRMKKKVHKGLIRRYEGPFSVIGRVGKVSYRVQLPPKLKIHPIFYVSFLKPYHRDKEDLERGVSKRAPTAVVTSYDREVEEILSDRTIRRRGVPSYKEYLIKWRDLPDSEASWEAEDLLWQFADKIKRYHEDGTTRTSRLSGILWKVEKGLGSPWNVLESVGRHRRRSNRRRVPNIVEPEIHTIEEVVSMADRTMEELLQAPTEGYGEAIVVPEILAENFEIKMNLLHLVQTNKFYGFERDNPHTHISNFKRMTLTLKYRDVPNDAIKLMLFPYSLEGAARIWYEKEPPNSILTWDDLVNKFVSQFFPPSKTTHLKNEISRFIQRFKETFGEAWERFKEMLRACLHYGFSELTKIDTFYNGLNEQDQDSLNAVQVITLATAKAVEKTCVICGGAHANYDCIATDSNQPSVCAATGRNLRRNLNNDMRSIIGSFFENQASNSGTLPSNIVPNPKGEMKVVTTRSGLAYEGPSIPTNSPIEKVVERDTEEITDKEQSNCQESTAHIQPSVVSISIPEPNVSKTQPKPNIPYPSRLNDQKLREKATNQMEKFFQIFHDFHFDISFADALLLMTKFASTIKSLLTNKDKLYELAKVPLNKNCSAMLLKKLLEKLRDPGKFFIPCDFPGIDVCHALADLGTSINLMPLSIWKKLSLPKLTPIWTTLELADRSITCQKGVAEDVFVKVEKFHIPTDFVVVDFKADPRVPLILGRSFLRTGRALIDVYGEEITLKVNDESVTFNLNQTMRYSSTYDDNYVNRVDVIDIACEEFVQDEPIVKSSSPTLTPFRESDFFLEDFEDFLNDESIPTGIKDSLYDPEGDILYL
nr:hypothetical protein [Tanacetum cinerariifolium]